MFKQMKCLLVSLVVLFGVITPQTALAAASDVKVFLDGQALVYDVPPQIVGGHTMVPLSLTIEAITGSPANWDGSTKTVTFYGGGHTNVHKIGEKIVYVDGSPVVFDSPSMIIDSRTLVPIRMIAETSGCTVDWDGSMKYVIITSPPSAPPVEESPKILECTTPLGTKIELGSAFKINVTTNGAALKVWAQGRFSGKWEEDEIWQGKLIDNGNADGKPKWEIIGYPLVSGQIRIYANKSESTTNAAMKTIDITVTQPVVEENPEILSYTTPNGTSIEKGSEFRVNVTTNGAVKSVWLEGPDGDEWSGKLANTGNTTGDQKWEIRCKPESSGKFRVYANKNSSSSNAATKTVSVTVTEKAAETNTTQQPKILSYSTPNGTTIDDGDEFIVVVTVNISVDDVWVENRGGDMWQGTITDAGNADGKQKWTVVLEPPLSSDKYYIYAQSSSASGSVATETVNVTVIK